MAVAVVFDPFRLGNKGRRVRMNTDKAVMLVLWRKNKRKTTVFINNR